MRAKRHGAGRETAERGVAAYLADDEAEVHNVIEAAVRENALAAALHLTAIAGDAVSQLAAARRVGPEQALRLLTGPRDTASHCSKRRLAAQVGYPGSMDDDDWAITEVKGWIQVTVTWPEGEKVITFYDPFRLAQEIDDGVAGHGYFAEAAVVVVPTVTREAIEAAVARMAESGFAVLS